MHNLILNSHWNPGPNGGPQYFSGVGSTFDNFCLNGYRTCSITMSGTNGTMGVDMYDPAIEVNGMRAINWGYTLRAIEAHCIMLVVDFYDENHHLIESAKQPITQQVTYQFSRQMAQFLIPCHAQTAQLSMEFSGKITACTYCAPTAYFC